MEPVLMYLLKMFICSAVLYGYYRLALYNERFHQWNRFYLLASMLLSVAVPLVSIPVMVTSQHSDLATVIALMPWNAGTGIEHTKFSWQKVVLVSATVVSAVFFLRVLIGIVKIVMAYRSNPVSSLQHNVQLIITQLTQAPFSFFNWLFWRHDIDPASENGRRMLNHELTHIREHHSIDKLFTSLLLCVFWMNPFFWMMRRELSMIHEFLADRKAIGPQDGAAFAEMILQALPLTPAVNNGLVNPFFSSQIKRRLLMITTSKDPKYSYLRRISGFALMVCSVFSLALSLQHAEAQKAEKKITIKEIIIKEKPATEKAEITEKSKSPEKLTITSADDGIYLVVDTVRYEKKRNGEITISAAGGGKVKSKDGTDSKVTYKMDLDNPVVSEQENSPIYILDGETITAEKMKSLDPNLIKSVNVLKGESAVSKYGEKAKNGAVEITLKTKEEQSAAKEKIVVKENGNQNNNQVLNSNKNVNPLYYVNGKSITAEDMKNIKASEVESINVLKGDNAIKKYGEKAKNGVVEITMKKPLN